MRENGTEMESGTRGKDRSALVARVQENPLRARLAAELDECGMSPAELAEAVGEPAALVAYHCRVLEEACGLKSPGSSSQ